MSAADTLVIVFAKAPRPGMAKTRLTPLLGAEGAAALHARLVRRALETACAARLGGVELHCDPDPGDPFFRSCALRYGVALKSQAAGDLGERMHAALERALQTGPRVLLIGCDCPALTAAHLHGADRALRQGHDAVLVPCEDGGYSLIGIKRAAPELFRAIAWGGGRVLSTTRERLAALDWRWQELETLWDVDRPEDYERLQRSGLLDIRNAAA